MKNAEVPGHEILEAPLNPSRGSPLLRTLTHCTAMLLLNVFPYYNRSTEDAVTTLLHTTLTHLDEPNTYATYTRLLCL